MNSDHFMRRILAVLSPIVSMLGLFEISSLIGRNSLETYFLGSTIDLATLGLIPSWVAVLQLLRIDRSRFLLLIPVLGYAFHLTVLLIISKVGPMLYTT